MKRGTGLKRTTGLKTTTRLVSKAPPKPRKPMKASRPKSTPARRSAAGQTCDIRVPGYCLPGNDTVVLCHYSLTAGGGQKEDDAQACFGCRVCHDLVDGRMRWESTPFTRVELRLMHAEGVFRRQTRLRNGAQDDDSPF